MIKDVLPVIKKTAEQVMKIYSDDFLFKIKKDKTPVTKADMLAHKLITESLKKFGWPILSEENTSSQSENEDKFWILDPLDGTQDFIDRTGEFSIMLGLVENSRPIFGIIYEPAKNIITYAEKNKGSVLISEDNKQIELKVSQIKEIEKAIAVMSRSHFSKKDKDFVDKMNLKNIKHHGSNGCKIRIIANQEADIFFNTYERLGQWDACAADIILSEAGGILTDLNGELINYTNNAANKVQGLIAANQNLHKKVLNFVL